MCPRSAATNARMRDAAREKIIAASLEAFAARGFDGAAVKEIAERAGVSKGLPYHYFKSKEALLAAALRSRLDDLLELTERVERLPDPETRLEALFDGLISHARERPEVFRFYLSVVLGAGGERLDGVAARLREPMDVYLGRLRDIFVDVGSADPETDAQLFRAVLLGVCVRLASGVEVPIPALKQRLLDTFLPRPVESES